MIDRTRNFRPTWKLNLTEPVASNYYPVDSRISVEEEANDVSETRNQIWVMTDRAQGGTSMKSGQVELMLHRRLFNDDAFGVGEALNETAFGVGLVVRGKHRVMLTNSPNADLESRLEAERMLMKPVLFFGPRCQRAMKDNFKALAEDIKVLTLEKLQEDSFLLRLENMGTRSRTIPKDSFGDYKEYIETTLDGNMNLSLLKRLKWNANITKKPRTPRTQDDDGYIEIPPKQIRTFIVKT